MKCVRQEAGALVEDCIPVEVKRLERWVLLTSAMANTASLALVMWKPSRTMFVVEKSFISIRLIILCMYCFCPYPFIFLIYNTTMLDFESNNTAALLLL